MLLGLRTCLGPVVFSLAFLPVSRRDSSVASLLDVSLASEVAYSSVSLVIN